MAFGFHREEREETELENLLGTNFVIGEKEPWPFHIGRAVGVYVARSTVHGIYRGLTERGEIVLLPSIQTEKYPKDITWKETYIRIYWENERPELIKYENALGVSPAKKEYLDWLIRKNEEMFNKPVTNTPKRARRNNQQK